jgi:hypothetical protein
MVVWVRASLCFIPLHSTAETACDRLLYGRRTSLDESEARSKDFSAHLVSFWQSVGFNTIWQSA